MHEEEKMIDGIPADVFNVNLACFRLLHVVIEHCLEDKALGLPKRREGSNLLAIFENKLDVTV